MTNDLDALKSQRARTELTIAAGGTQPAVAELYAPSGLATLNIRRALFAQSDAVRGTNVSTNVDLSETHIDHPGASIYGVNRPTFGTAERKGQCQHGRNSKTVTHHTNHHPKKLSYARSRQDCP